MRLVERYFCKYGLKITDVVEKEDLVSVTTFGSWDVRPVERFKIIARSPGYRLYSIESDAGNVDGVAMLPGDAMFHLDDTRELKAFVAAAHSLLAPLELAALLVWFQSAHVENVIVDLDDLATWFHQEDIAAHPVRLPAAVTRGDGALDLAFDTKFSSRSRGYKMNLNRWHVDLDAKGAISWRTRAMARDLESPFYSGKRG
ncbi:Hypothetical protein A7982_04684 [Minicystis rosea]|nr:Hypothetical protein A7982_04684 [Minicystis rosea]